MTKLVEYQVNYWLSFIVLQQGLFRQFSQDFFSVGSTITSKVTKSMKRMLYIVAKSTKKKLKTESVAEGINSQTQEQLPSIAPEVTKQEPIIVTQEDMLEDDGGKEADITIRIETGKSDETEVSAAYFLALTKKLNEVLTKLDEVLKDNTTLKERTTNMALKLDSLVAEVAKVKTVQDSAIALLHKLADEITANIEDPKALNDIVDQLKGSTSELAAAVAASAGVIPTHEVILHADDPTTPTVSVVLPEVLPEHIEVTVEKEVEVVDPASPEPQYTLTVEEAAPATVEAVEAAPAADVANPEVLIPSVEGDLSTSVVKTDEGQVDVTVAAPAEAVEAAAVDGVEVHEAIQEAYTETEAITAVAEPVVEAAPAVEAPVEAPVEEAPKTE